MKKDNTRLVGYSSAMTEYPDLLHSPFDRQLCAGLAWVLIDQQGIGWDRRELHRHHKHTQSTRAVVTKAGTR